MVDSLGDRIRQQRLDLGFTLRSTARHAAIAPAFLADIEAGRRMPGPDVFARLAAVLELALAELQALDPRVTPEVREWMESDPRVSTFLQALCLRPDRDARLESLTGPQQVTPAFAPLGIIHGPAMPVESGKTCRTTCSRHGTAHQHRWIEDGETRDRVLPDAVGTAMFGDFIREIAVNLDGLETAGFTPVAIALRGDLWPQLADWHGYPIVRIGGNGMAWGVLT